MPETAVFCQRIPVPIAMWTPFQREGACLSLFGPGYHCGWTKDSTDRPQANAHLPGNLRQRETTAPQGGGLIALEYHLGTAHGLAGLGQATGEGNAVSRDRQHHSCCPARIHWPTALLTLMQYGTN
jgi:hypothetical protein